VAFLQLKAHGFVARFAYLMKLGVHRFVFSQVALMDGVASLGCFGATEEGLH
jgi:hypothetical protein